MLLSVNDLILSRLLLRGLFSGLHRSSGRILHSMGQGVHRDLLRVASTMLGSKFSNSSDVVFEFVSFLNYGIVLSPFRYRRNIASLTASS